MGLFGIIKAIYNVLCGPGDSKPDIGKPEHKPPQQQHQVPGGYPPPHHGGHVPQKPPRPPQQQPQKPSGRPNKYQNDNEINSNNEHYKSLRARANDEGEAMAQAFSASHDAYNRGDHAAAKQFSTKGKEHQRKMEQLNKQASDWIFEQNNLDSQPDEIDLHGLYVKEALSRTEQAIEDARRRGQTEIKLIVGKGLHSSSGAKIKPAIEDLMKKYQLDAEIDPNNSGVLIVRLNRGRSRMGADEITRRIERNDEACAIM